MMNRRSDMLSNELQISEGSILGKSHRVEAFLGEGGFGFVTKCRDINTGKMAAVKINKNDPEIVRQTKLEICVLKKLRRLNPETCNIVRWDGFFFDKDRVCLNFELLDQSLLDYMEDRNNRGLPMSEVRPILHQLTKGLSHLKSIGIVHADLKLENVMVVDRHQKPLKVKIIDFGLARPVSAVVPGVCVQTLWYRAPEVMLHIPFNEAIDMWSLGLVAAELTTGFTLYHGELEYDVLCSIIQTQGQPEDHVLDRGRGTGYYFQHQENSQHQHWQFKSPQQFEYETGLQTSETRFAKLGSLDDLEQFMDERDQQDRHLLVDLIKRMLHLDPENRIKPQEAMQHPFFVPSHPQTYPADVVIDMSEIEDAEPELAQQPENIHHRFSRTKVSPPPEESEEKADDQLEDNAENSGWWQYFVKKIRHAVSFVFWGG